MRRASTKRVTVYLDDDLHKALRLKSVEIEQDVSRLINNAVRDSLSEDAEDLQSIENRKREKSISFEDAVKKLKTRGRI